MTLGGKYLYTTLLFFLIIVLLGCQTGDDKKKYFLKVKGYAQGSTYSITYSDHLQRDFSYSIDSILKIVDSQLSTYDSNSFISLLNKSKDTCNNWPSYCLWSRLGCRMVYSCCTYCSNKRENKICKYTRTFKRCWNGIFNYRFNGLSFSRFYGF